MDTKSYLILSDGRGSLSGIIYGPTCLPLPLFDVVGYVGVFSSACSSGAECGKVEFFARDNWTVLYLPQRTVSTRAFAVMLKIGLLAKYPRPTFREFPEAT